MAAQVGVDVGSSAIKVVQLGGSGGKRTVEAMGLGINPVGGWGETEAQSLQLAEAIRKTIGDAGVKLKRVRVALHEALVRGGTGVGAILGSGAVCAGTLKRGEPGLADFGQPGDGR